MDADEITIDPYEADDMYYDGPVVSLINANVLPENSIIGQYEFKSIEEFERFVHKCRKALDDWRRSLK